MHQVLRYSFSVMGKMSQKPAYKTGRNWSPALHFQWKSHKMNILETKCILFLIWKIKISFKIIFLVDILAFFCCCCVGSNGARDGKCKIHFLA